jgi:hypothetical protein
VIVRIGASKTDRDGTKAEQHPRVLPIANGFLSAGRWLKELFRERFKLGARAGLSPGLRSRYRPLLQDRKGDHLKESAVLASMRRVLKDNKYSDAATKNFGAHSFRIGGFTRCFHVDWAPRSRHCATSEGGPPMHGRRTYVFNGTTPKKCTAKMYMAGEMPETNGHSVLWC